MDSPISVVVVDDNALMIWGLRQLIGGQGPSVVLADSVSRTADLVRSVRQHQPDVVLLEIDIEGESGVELIDLVNEACAARIIIFTGNRNASVHERAILAGAHGLVLKSEPVEVVLRAIKAVHAGELWLKRDVTAKIMGMMTAAYHQSSTPNHNSLFTPSENRVIAAAVKYRGAPNKVIADVLHMSANTFRNHLSTIYGKLGIHRRLDLVLYGIRHGGGDPGELPMSAEPIAGMRPVAPVNGVAPASTDLVGSRAATDEAREVTEDSSASPRSAASPMEGLRGLDVRRLADSAIGGIGTVTGTHAQVPPPVRVIRAALRRAGASSIPRR